MSQTPNAIAVTDGDLEWTYDDLRRQSDIVARSLTGLGISPGSVVGMHLTRCADAIAVMLGIMASGYVYLPLDPSYPSARLRYMLDQADAVAVISNDSDPDLYGSDRLWLPTPSQLDTEPNVADSELPIYSSEREPFKPEDCAYILFTSGSTGNPKGVMVTHENIMAMKEWSAKVLGVTAVDASATTCSLSFDPSFLEILVPLSVGGTVHVIPHALALGHLTRQVSFVSTTPSVASELLRAGQLPPLKAVIVGGEVLAPDVAARLLSSGRVGRLLNCYGPTECTVCVTVEEVTLPTPGIIPIGRQVPGTEILILDESGQRLPDGELGEICIFGRQVARGYVNDPSKTAERFAVGPSDSTEPQRYYRTGDLGHRTDDGVIYFAGRADRQVKINGVRIELGEIEAALRSHPQISEAAAIAQDHDRTVAYVVPAQPGADVDIADLKKHLSQSLPRFMVPGGIVVLTELPMTVNGKLDSSALPEWSPSRLESEFTSTDDLDDQTARVIEIVADVTGFVGQIRPSDDFIDDLGGTSLGIVRVLVELERYSGRRIRINDALANTSVAGFVSLLHEEAASPSADFAFNTEGNAPPLFLIHSYLGSMLGLRRIAELMPPNQPVYGLHIYPDTEQFDDELSISSLAQNALNRIREVQPTGQITMLGQSAGGLIVFEVARRMLEAGDPEPRVLLMDSPRIYSSFGYYWGESVLHPREIVPNATNIFLEAVTRRFPAIRSKEGHTQVTSQPDDLMALNERHLKSTAAAIRSYKAEAYNGSITVMRTRQGRMMALGRRHLGWASVTRSAVRIIDVPGAHLNMLDEPYVDTVTEKLIDWLSSRQLQISDRALTVGHSGAGYERCRDILAPGSRIAVAIRLDSAVP
jgi:amino acid adenylation domain-containing protein